MEYKKIKKMIYRICWDFKKKNPSIDFEDLLGEANLCYVKCLKTFDINKKNKFTTFFYKCCINHLIQYHRKEKNKKNDYELDETLIHNHNEFKFFELSDMAQRIVKEIYLSGLQNITLIKPYIHKKMNISYKDISASFAEIKEILLS